MSCRKSCELGEQRVMRIDAFLDHFWLLTLASKGDGSASKFDGDPNSSHSRVE